MINMEGNKWTERKHGVWRVRGGRCYGGYGNDGRRGCEGGGERVMESRWRKGWKKRVEKEKEGKEGKEGEKGDGVKVEKVSWS